MSEGQQSDALRRLVVFVIVPAILGTILALARYYAVELPAQAALLHTPRSCYPCPCGFPTKCVGGCCRPPGAV